MHSDELDACTRDDSAVTQVGILASNFLTWIVLQRSEYVRVLSLVHTSHETHLVRDAF